MSGWFINGIMGNPVMVPNTPQKNSLFSPSEENLRHKGTGWGWGRTKSAAPNRVDVDVCFRSPPLFIVVVRRAAIELCPGIPIYHNS